MRTTKPQKRRTEKKPEHKPEKAAPVKRSHMSQWYQPTIRDVYAAVCEAKTMLDRIPDIELAAAKRKMQDLEDTIWQFATAR